MSGSRRRRVVTFLALAALSLLVLCWTQATSNNSWISQRPAFMLQGQPSVAAAAAAAAQELRSLYLEAVRDSILGVHLATPSRVPGLSSTLEQRPFDQAAREKGADWPLYGLSMAGQRRLNNMRQLLEDVLARGVPGSFVECGVWRGGAALFAKAVLRAHGATREVHLADSFEGLPPNTTQQDNSNWSKMGYLRVSQPEVAAGFQRFGLLDDRVFFHKGYFRYALPAWRAEGTMGPIAVLRMDGDMYESTMDELYNLWEAVSPGGYIIVDDYRIPPCKKAVHEFLERHGIAPVLQDIDGMGAYFQKPTAAPPFDDSWYASWNASRTTDDAKP